MKPPPDPHGQASFMLWEGLTLLLIENGVVRKDDVVKVVEEIIAIIQNTSKKLRNDKTKLALIRQLQVISESVSAANSSPLLPNGCDGRGSCLFVAQ
jgi:MOSC domain-containing protein YiiM